MSAPGERARLFVALDLDDAARAALVAWRDGIVAGRAGLRAVPAEALHVTLCFLGACTVDDVEGIAGACAAAAADGSVTGLAVGSARWLPSRRPRVLAVAVEDSAGALTAVQASLSAALAESGWYRPEARPFFPHVTVARVARGGPGREEVSAPPALPLAPGAPVTLYRSHLSPRGVRYEALRSVVPGSASREQTRESARPRDR